MKIKYNFHVEGTFRLGTPRRFFFQDATVSVQLTNKSVLRKIFITFDVHGSFELPKILESGEEGIAGEIVIPQPPRADDARSIAARLEDKLSVFGVERFIRADARLSARCLDQCADQNDQQCLFLSFRSVS